MSKLTTIAAGMRTTIAGQPAAWTAASLPGGLDIVLSHQHEAWRLALRREKTPPSATEAEILREAFGIPDDCPIVPRSKTETHPVSKRTIRWQILEFCWREIPPAGAAGTPQPA